MVFQLDKALPAGEATLVQSWFFPLDIKVKKNFVQISGRLLSADDEGLAGRVTVKAQFEQTASGKKGQSITLNAEVDGDGFFSASGKIKKNIAAGDLMMVTAQPTVSAIPDGAKLTVCVDLVKKKADLAALPDCVQADGGGEAAVTFTELQNEFFTPTCAVSGCHSAASANAGLVLVAGQAFGNLVNVPSTQRPRFNRIMPNDPDNSYVVKKLRGDADIDGDRMPAGGPFLGPGEIDRFVSWINDGAPNN
ncbi:MAG: hypothetical protein OES47_07625 [Acidobacteriota bacterium]|nr:hypothetical protein [Acidobacteriota bacterium]